MQDIAYKMININIISNLLHIKLYWCIIYLGDKMKIYGMQTNEVILKEIGKRIKSRRILLSITQNELALEAEVSLRTIINAENGENFSLANLISILRAIRVAENLDLLLPENKTDPIEVFKLGHARKRVSKVKTVSRRDWKWGDEK